MFPGNVYNTGFRFFIHIFHFFDCGGQGLQSLCFSAFFLFAFINLFATIQRVNKHRGVYVWMNLNVTSEDKAEATVVSNLFIDEYMKDANDAQIKIYLYLLRMMSAGLPTDVSKIADLFNHTEREVVRSLEYWQKRGLLSLEYNHSGQLTGIRFRQIDSVSTAEAPAYRPAPQAALKVVPDDESVLRFNENISYTRDQLKAFKENGETSQIVFVAEQYLKRTLTTSDIQALYFIYDELKFTCEMTDYLLQYCLDRGKDNFSYIKKVAINWAQSGITTPKQAKELAGAHYEKYVYTALKALGKSNIPQQPEADMVTKWYKEYGFDLDIILEACKRTVIATDSHRLEYCDKILLAWKKAGVHHVKDIAAVDAAFKGNRAKETASRASGTFGQFDRHDYDFAELEKILSN